MSRRLRAGVLRKASLWERIRACFNLNDNVIWLQEQLSSYDWEGLDKSHGNTIAVAFNLALIFARANSSISSDGNDIFNDEPSTSGGIFSSLFSLFSFLLLCFSIANAAYTTFRSRPYRLFHADINQRPSNVSARLVKVDSSPATSSPLRFLTQAISRETPEDRAHPNENQDVWEVSVWDPIPICLRLAVLFSPGNALVTWYLLPTDSSTQKSGLTIAYTVVICILLSGQGYILQKCFSQQSKDSTSIHSQVLNEYDIKYVHPSTHKIPVDVGIQFPACSYRQNNKIVHVPEVTSYRNPKTFTIRPNPNYASHYDRENILKMDQTTKQHNDSPQQYVTPENRYHSYSYSAVPDSTPDIQSSPIRAAQNPKPLFSYSDKNLRNVSTATSGLGDGGSFGVFTHAASPLRKAASANLLRNGGSDLRRREGNPFRKAANASGPISRHGNSSYRDY